MMDKLPNLSPHLVTHPVALIAFGLVLVVFLAIVGAPWWAFVLVVAGVVAAIVALGKYPHLRLADEHLLAYLRAQFEGFEGDAFQSSPSQRADADRSDGAQEAVGDLDGLRVEEYERNRGLFLTHTWRPSEKQGQVADLIIRLQEHSDTSTRPSLLAEGKVESVTYELGRRFFSAPVTKRNREDNFALEVSAYRPMLCLAEVTVNDGHPPVRLSRYIDFPTDL
jgi:hypothetical protein